MQRCACTNALPSCCSRPASGSNSAFAGAAGAGQQLAGAGSTLPHLVRLDASETSCWQVSQSDHHLRFAALTYREFGWPMTPPDRTATRLDSTHLPANGTARTTATRVRQHRTGSRIAAVGPKPGHRRRTGSLCTGGGFAQYLPTDSLWHSDDQTVRE